MNIDFHYPTRAWHALKRQLPTHAYPREKFLSEYRPHWFTEDEWRALDYDDDDSPNKIKVWVDANTRQEITPISKHSGPHISARELFLESMRQRIQETLISREEGMFLTSGEIRKRLEKCDTEFSRIIDFLDKQPIYLRCLLDTHRLDSLNSILKKLIQSTREPFIDPPGYRLPPNIFRDEFLKTILLEYRKFFGKLPNHTRGQPFNAVSEELCGFAGFSSQGMEDALAKAKEKLT